ncbi:MAG: type II toxin-antitoxin system HipA family toxin YjjJ [Pseudomonadota bacterium]
MPKKQKLNYEALQDELLSHLRKGPEKAKKLCQLLRISQPAFSRLVNKMEEKVCTFGAASQTLYGLKREIPKVGFTINIYVVDEKGQSTLYGELFSISPKGFCFVLKEEGIFQDKFFEDLPFFLDDLRPNGFLGRLIPHTHSELDLPKNINQWTSNHCLQYLTEYGTDLIGNLILGDRAFERYLAKTQKSKPGIQLSERIHEYPQMANNILQYGDPGSSAGGEQPKFPAVLENEKSVLVKFSPKLNNPLAMRRADLLICEHISHRVLKDHGHLSSKSELIFGENQLFLEVKRFDRIGFFGRRGVISLNALNNEYIGITGDWKKVAQALLKQKIITQKIAEEIYWQHIYGKLIANSDMHLANLSLYFDKGTVTGITPSYDMLPMLYAPQNEEVVSREFTPPLPTPSESIIFKKVLSVAIDFWERVTNDLHVSSNFREIASQNMIKVKSLEKITKLLPE